MAQALSCLALKADAGTLGLLLQLPYHVAWQRGFRQAATVLNPTIAIDIALETAHDLDDGEAHPSM